MVIFLFFLNIITSIFTSQFVGNIAIESSFDNYQESISRTIVQDINTFAISYYVENAKYPEFEEINIEKESYSVFSGIIIIGDPKTRQVRVVENSFCYESTEDNYSVGVDIDLDGEIDYKLGNDEDLCVGVNI